MIRRFKAWRVVQVHGINRSAKAERSLKDWETTAVRMKFLTQVSPHTFNSCGEKRNKLSYTSNFKNNAIFIKNVRVQNQSVFKQNIYNGEFDPGSG